MDLTPYQAEIEAGIAVKRTAGQIARRIIARHSLQSEQYTPLVAAIEHRLAAPPPGRVTPPDAPPSPAPLFPPPPAPTAPQAEPAAPSPPKLAPNARQEPPVSSDLGDAIARAVPTALSLYRVALDDGSLKEIVQSVRETAARAARRAKARALTEGERDDLRLEVCTDARCVAPTLPEAALEEIGGLVIDAIDASTNTGPLEEVDGEIAKRGLAALIEKIDLWSLDAGNLEARAQRAQRRAERAQAEADRLRKILERKRAKS